MAVLLAGLLPAVVALDSSDPARVDRAAAFVLVIIGATLAGGVLRDLPAAACLLCLAVAATEAMFAASRRGRVRIAAVGVVAAFMIALAAAFAPPQAPASGLVTTSVLALALANAAALAAAMAGATARRMAGLRRRLWTLRRGAFTASETVVALDGAGRVVAAGRNARKALGLPRQALVGRGLADLTLVADRPALLAACATPRGGAGQTAVRFRLRADASEAVPRHRWVELRFSGAVLGEARLAGLRDVSGEVEDEARRMEALAAAERADAARQAFLATVSHELRTPLNAIVGFSEFLANPTTTPSDEARVREYAGIIHQAGHDLLRKVAAMIEITRMQSGAYDLALEAQDAASIVHAAVAGFLAERRLGADAVRVELPAGPVAAELDARALHAALSELLGNAFKHGLGEKACVALSTDGGFLVVAVRDGGPGVAADRLAMLERDLARGDEALTRTKGGLGLGLTLARSVMALHGGSVVFTNRAEGGAEATLRLPAARPAAASTLVDLDSRRGKSAAEAPARRKKKRA